MTAAEIAAALGGKPSGAGFICRCPLPGHGQGRGDRTPSLSVSDGDRAVLFHCFAGCDPGQVLGELLRHGLITKSRHSSRKTRNRRRFAHPAIGTIVAKQVESEPRALEIWRAAGPAGDVVKAYLNGRGLAFPPPPTLRQGLMTPLGRTPIPTLVAAVQSSGGKIIATQELRLTWSGSKSSLTLTRKTTGKLNDGAVRLGPACEILGLTEGIETDLSAMQLSHIPTWCSLGAARLDQLAIPDCVRELHVFADNDEPGQAAAVRAANRWTRGGLKLWVRFPPTGINDWNDYLQILERGCGCPNP